MFCLLNDSRSTMDFKQKKRFIPIEGMKRELHGTTQIHSLLNALYCVQTYASQDNGKAPSPLTGCAGSVCPPGSIHSCVHYRNPTVCGSLRMKKQKLLLPVKGFPYLVLLWILTLQGTNVKLFIKIIVTPVNNRSCLPKRPPVALPGTGGNPGKNRFGIPVHPLY